MRERERERENKKDKSPDKTASRDCTEIAVILLHTVNLKPYRLRVRREREREPR